MGVTSTAKRGDARSASRRFSRLQYEVIGVLLTTLSLLTLLSLVSFTPSDVPLFGASPSDTASPGQTRNMIGTVGATLAVVLFRLMGAAADLLPFLLAMLGVRCFVEGPLTVTVRSAGGSLLSLLFLSSLLHLEVTAVPTLIGGLVYRGMAGGLVGQLIAEGLKSAFASTGAHIIVAAGLVVSLLLATPISLVDLRRRVPGWWQSFTEAVAAIAPALPERADRGEKVNKDKPKPVKINRSVPVGDNEGIVAIEAPSEPASTGVSARTGGEPARLEAESEVI